MSALATTPIAQGPFVGSLVGIVAALRAPLAVLQVRAPAVLAPAAFAHDGEPAAARFRAEMLPHLDAAYNLARFLCRDPDAAQDIVQEAYLRACRSFATFRGGSARAWILAIVRNCHRDWRSDRRQTETFDPIDEEGEEHAVPRDDETPETHLLRRSEAQEVRRHLASVPEPFREVLVLRELEDLSYREIAEVTATPVGTVMSRLARARKLFATAWSSSAGAAAETTR